MGARFQGFSLFSILFSAILILAGCGGGNSTPNPNPNPQPQTFQVTVTGLTAGVGTVTSSPAGINCPTTCTGSFAQNTQVTLTATPAAGYTFASWGAPCSGNASTCQVTVTAATSIAATFNAPPVALTISETGTGTVTSTPSGINCPGACTANFASGSQVTLTEAPGTGFQFGSWGGACSGSGAGSSCALTISAATSAVLASFTPTGPVGSLAVTLSGVGSGTVTSSPAGINCPGTCNATFSTSTPVTLTASPAATPKSAFAAWSGACTGPTACTVTVSTTTASNVNASFGLTLQSAVNHIIFLAQENRGFEHYFGAMRQYWARTRNQYHFQDQAFDGFPYDPATDTLGTYSNVGCDPAFPYDPNGNPPQTNDCTIDPNSPVVQSFHAITRCLENPSPSWNETHVDMNRTDPSMSHTKKPPLDGFVWTAGHDARSDNFFDTNGLRAMAYYDWTDMPYYYFMASSFATSDRWFSPVMTRTQPNRMYALAATSHGHAYPIPSGGSVLQDPTIFDLLQSKGISWKVYVTDLTYGVNLVDDTALHMFATAAKYPQNIVPVSQFTTDLQNGTLPSVIYIEPGLDSGRDEHPGIDDGRPGTQVQFGAQYIESLIDQLMGSQYWKDSVFILTFDEYGGFYDHVPPQKTVSPDGIPPSDLLQGPPPAGAPGPDVCVSPNATGPTCDFVYTGYRVPLIVVSPFSKKNYVSHTVTDYTAWLKLVETRFGLSNLTARDAAQIDMTEFFDFVNEPWKTPPTSIPPQMQDGQCYVDHLP